MISGGANGYANGEEVAELGCPQCPRINETPLIEPLVCKKIAHERLTALVFREDCLVTACQDGYVCTWARPGKVVSLFIYNYLDCYICVAIHLFVLLSIQMLSPGVVEPGVRIWQLG